jgi:outer membrane protein W
MNSIARCVLSILLFAIPAAPRIALADPNNPTDNDKAAARPFAIEGIRLAQSGNCAEAVDKLGRSESLVHAPTTSLPLAECEIRLGRIILGTEILNRLIIEPLPPNAPPSWAEAKNKARPALDAAQPRIAKLRIHVDVPPGVTPRPEVTVDGQPVQAVLLDNDRPTDPGNHHIVANQVGLTSASADVSLAEGQVRNVSLKLEGQAGAAMAATPAAGGAVDPYGQNAAAAPPGNADPFGQGAAGQGAAAAATPAAESAGGPWMAAEFGVRLAFGLPFGGATGANGDNLDHAISNMIAPLWLDGGFRFASNWYAGGYFMFGLTSLADQFAMGSCKLNGVGCSSNDTRLGVNLHYHVLPDGQFDPWFGVGFGYEWLSQSLSASAQNISRSAGVSGWEFVNFQAGLDVHVLKGALGVGPFLSLTIDQYNSSSVPSDNMGGTMSKSITDQTIHEWFLFGVRGVYDLKIVP